MAFSFLSNISLIENSITSLCLFLYHPIETDTGKGIQYYYILKDLEKKKNLNSELKKHACLIVRMISYRNSTFFP